LDFDDFVTWPDRGYQLELSDRFRRLLAILPAYNHSKVSIMGEVVRHHCDSRCVGVRLDREVAARRAVCRASRPPDT